jgi:Cu/Ag efflux protein CusF
MKIKSAIFSVALVSVIGLTNTYAATTKSETSPKGEIDAVSTEVKATVKDIDYKTRKVTLQTMDGEKHNIIAGESIKNLNQVKKGDTVVANYSEALVYEISKGGKASAPTETAMGQSARPGANPEGVVARQVTASVIISAIDRKTPAVTFKNADGDTQTFKVKHPERLEGVKVGDRVSITYMEAFALKVEKTAKQ